MSLALLILFVGFGVLIVMAYPPRVAVGSGLVALMTVGVTADIEAEKFDDRRTSHADHADQSAQYAAFIGQDA